MKIIILSLVFAVLIAVALGQSAMETAKMACMAETKVSKQEVDDLCKSIPTDATPANMKCFTKCFMEKMGEFKDGVFDAEKAQKDFKEMLEQAQMTPIDPQAFPKCKNEKGANDCETAFNILKCLKEFKA